MTRLETLRAAGLVGLVPEYEITEMVALLVRLVRYWEAPEQDELLADLGNIASDARALLGRIGYKG